MKVQPEEPDVEAAVSYFVDMAKGKTAPTKHAAHRGLGAVRHPTTFHVIPKVELISPTAEALDRAKASLSREKVIRGQTRSRKRKAGEHTSSGKSRKTKDQYHMPGLD